MARCVHSGKTIDGAKALLTLPLPAPRGAGQGRGRRSTDADMADSMKCRTHDCAPSTTSPAENLFGQVMPRAQPQSIGGHVPRPHAAIAAREDVCGAGKCSATDRRAQSPNLDFILAMRRAVRSTTPTRSDPKRAVTPPHQVIDMTITHETFGEQSGYRGVRRQIHTDSDWPIRRTAKNSAADGSPRRRAAVRFYRKTCCMHTDAFIQSSRATVLRPLRMLSSTQTADTKPVEFQSSSGTLESCRMTGSANDRRRHCRRQIRESPRCGAESALSAALQTYLRRHFIALGRCDARARREWVLRR